jgi:hypothetical protein
MNHMAASANRALKMMISTSRSLQWPTMRMLLTAALLLYLLVFAFTTHMTLILSDFMVIQPVDVPLSLLDLLSTKERNKAVRALTASDIGATASSGSGVAYNEDQIAAATGKLQAQLTDVKQLQDFRQILIEKMKADNNTNVANLYFDFGLSMGLDTKLYLSKGYSVVSVDAFLPWVEKARKDHSKAVNHDHKLIAFNVGVTDPSARDFNAEGMPLYFIKEGDVRASFMQEKGCVGYPVDAPECKHVVVPTVPCESIVQLIGTGGGISDGGTPIRAEIMKVDIEMMHHTCLRALQNVDTNLLPRYVCWEDHDKDFGTARLKSPIMDTKLILLLFELGYDGIKIVMQGEAAAPFYGFRNPREAGLWKFSGNLHPEEMLHYRSYEQNNVTYYQKRGKWLPALVFDTHWRSVSDVLLEGVMSPGRAVPGTNLPLAKHFNREKTYYDLCMKLNLADNAQASRSIRQHPENFPISRTRGNSHLFR